MSKENLKIALGKGINACLEELESTISPNSTYYNDFILAKGRYSESLTHFTNGHISSDEFDKKTEKIRAVLISTIENIDTNDLKKKDNSFFSNPDFMLDLRELQKKFNFFSVLDKSNTIIIVIGCHLYSELLDRPVAEMLKKVIDSKGNYRNGKRAVILGDRQYLYDEKETVQGVNDEYEQQFCPTISVGVPDYNWLTTLIFENAQEQYEEDYRFAQITENGKNRIAVCGYNILDNKSAVSKFIETRLDKFLKEVW